MAASTSVYREQCGGEGILRDLPTDAFGVGYERRIKELALADYIRQCEEAEVESETPSNITIHPLGTPFAWAYTIWVKKVYWTATASVTSYAFTCPICGIDSHTKNLGEQTCPTCTANVILSEE